MIEMYAIKDNGSKEYYNFKEDSFVEQLCGQCLLPTESLAFDFYDQYLGGDQKVVRIAIAETDGRGYVTSYYERTISFEDSED